MKTKELTPPQIARILGVSRQTVHNMIQAGHITNVSRPSERRMHVPIDSIDEDSGRIKALKRAHEELDVVLGRVIGEGDLLVIRGVRVAIEHLETYMDTPSPANLTGVLRSIADAAVVRPEGNCCRPLLNVVNDLTAVFRGAS